MEFNPKEELLQSGYKWRNYGRSTVSTIQWRNDGRDTVKHNSVEMLQYMSYLCGIPYLDEQNSGFPIEKLWSLRVIEADLTHLSHGETGHREYESQSHSVIWLLSHSQHTYWPTLRWHDVNQTNARQ